jgi:hypothetical protein
MTMDNALIIARAREIADFADNLLKASCAGSRRDAVEFLARRIGSDDARRIAEAFGLTGGFFFATI